MKLTVGTMNFGGRTPAQEAVRIIARALERGATFFDTANVYNDGAAERIVGEAVRARRALVQLATKVGLLRKGGRPEGLGKATLTQALRDSLQRLGTDYVDLYYLHAPDPSTPFEETLDALQPMLESGQVRDWGVSNFAAWQILELQHLCDARGMKRPRASQVLYNLLIRQLDIEYFAFAKRHPIHTTVYNPLAGGLLARAEAPPPPGSRLATNKLYQRRYGSEALRAQAAQYAALAQKHGLDLVTLAYAWLAQRDGVDSILAGPATVEHLDAALDAIERPLTSELTAEIDDLHRAFVGTDATYRR